MIHGSCGVINPNIGCMRYGKCMKDYPKQFNEFTCDNGSHAEVCGSCLDSWYVIPYSPYLLAKFNYHVNVEVCTTALNTFINTCICSIGFIYRIDRMLTFKKGKNVKQLKIISIF
jgi:hypothetical protein